MADIGYDRLILHLGHVFEGDDVLVTGGGDVDVGTTEGFLDGGDFESFHSSLEGVDRINLGDDDAGALTAEGLGGAFTYVPIAANNGDFA